MGRSCLERRIKSSAIMEKIHELPPVVILRLRNMTAIDATGLFALEEVARELHATKRTLILCGAREQPAQLIRQAEFEDVIGHENICDNVQAALRRAEDVFERMEKQGGGGRPVRSVLPRRPNSSAFRRPPRPFRGSEAIYCLRPPSELVPALSPSSYLPLAWTSP